jgi:hypothetical protein
MVDIKVNIGGERYDIPEWITVDMFARLDGIEIENPAHDHLLCATLLNAPVKLVKQIGYEDLQWIKLILVQPLATSEHALIKGQIHGFKLIDFDKTTIGQFADLDVLTAEGIQSNIALITSILYSAPIEEVYGWNIMWILPSLQQWKTYREQIYMGYKNLFGIDEVDPDSEEPVDETPVKVDNRQAWYELLMTLCNDRYLDLERVTERPLIEALNYLAYMKSKNLRLKSEMERGMKNYKTK